ncbi:thioredoxin family protein [Porticoccaceae bacterium LTM1]|nr:thioredoxin family protein [Porticoccaceae bacterium LTM1]
MKKVLIALGLTLVSCAVFAEGMTFFYGSFDEALAKAKAEQKLLFVDVYTDWCGPCKMMANNVFPSKGVGDFYNQNFINYKVDAEKEQGPELIERYPAEGYPTYWFINGNGKLVKSKAGAMSAQLFIELGREALGQSISYEDLQARYDNGERSAELMQKMLLKAPLYSQKFERGSEAQTSFWDGISEMSQKYFESRSLDELINATDFSLIKTYLDGPNRGQRVPELVFSHYDQFANVAPEAELSSYILRTNNLTIHKLARKGDEGYLKYVEEIRTNNAIKKASAYSKEHAEKDDKFSQLDSYEVMRLAGGLGYYPAKGDWKQYANFSEEYLALQQSVGAETAFDYIHPVASILDSCEDMEVLRRFEVMARQGYEMDKQVYILAIYGKLLAKLGEKEKAKAVLEEGLALNPEGEGSFIKQIKESLKAL